MVETQATESERAEEKGGDAAAAEAALEAKKSSRRRTKTGCLSASRKISFLFRTNLTQLVARGASNVERNIQYVL
jgi:hypothetical protein